MKKMFLSFGIMLLAATAAMAQTKKAPKGGVVDNKLTAQTAATAPTNASTLTVDNIKLDNDSHDFGTVSEGPAADHIFMVTNTGKEPLVITKVQPSCGCTTPSWTKEPIAPGKTGEIKASYGTQGRPGTFTKTLTVFSNAGNKVLTIKGNVEKAPTSSVPENSSMIRTN